MSIRTWLAMPVSGASLAMLRFSFGAVQIWQTWEFVRPIQSGNKTTLEYLYTGKDAVWNFPYPNFEWVAPLPEPWTSILFAVLGLSSVTMMLGWMSRCSSLVNSLLFTYAWMLESTWWNNHYYLSSLFGLMLFLTPCGRCLSIDRWLETRRTGVGSQTDALIPFWPIWWFRAELYVVYTYAAVVKMNPDWFMGEPPRLWFRSQLAAQPLSWVVSPEAMKTFFAVLSSEPVVYMFVWGGLVFDLVIGALLCIRRTQVLGLVLMVLFHGTNFWVFMIGAFPMMAIASTLIFLDPDWPLRFWAWLRKPTFSPPDPGWMLAGMLLVPVVGAALGWKIPRSPSTSTSTAARPVSPLLPWGLAAWMLVQILLPLRHLTIPGDVHWTLEGSRFSWQVMARVHVGLIRYRLVDPRWDTHPPRNASDWPTTEQTPTDRLYRDCDSTQLPIFEPGKPVIVFEPWVRERIFVPSENTSDADVRKQIGQFWQEQYGRRPTAIAQTIPLPDALRTFQENLRPRPEWKGNEADILAKIAQRTADHYADLAATSTDDPFFLEKSLDLQLQIGSLRQQAERMGCQGELLAALLLAEPFSMQSARGRHWHQVIDKDLLIQELPSFDASRIRWDRWIGPPLIWVDLDRIPAQPMQTLPKRMNGFDKSGHPCVHWNADRDLVPMQVDFHSSTGLMIHQYAQGRIAPFWQQQTGVWPRVFVESFSKLNQHPLQRLIDPATDLARVPLKIWTHNEWILPQEFRTDIYHEAGVPRMRTRRTPGVHSPY